MTSSRVTTRLHFKTGVNEFQDEDAIVAWAAAHAAARPGLFDLEGGVNVACGAVQFGIGDDLTALVTQLCFVAPAAVARGETAAFDLVNDPETYTLRREGTEIEIAGTLIETNRFPASALLEALVACGERYIALLGRVWADEPGLPDLLADLKGAAETARRALAAAPHAG
ncbi:MAG: hypothetical protein J0I21_01850 [Alphaproteobacteria bacterium]|nr:hypothetical protein [Alphaproteobacteria bacterium]